MAPPTGMDQRWQSKDAGAKYSEQRFSSQRARERDPRLVRKILAGLTFAPGSISLDVPCGAGRLRTTLAEAGLSYIGVDISHAMLAAAADRALLQASVRALPFRNACFDLVLSCRLLHHVREEEELAVILRELLRVTRGWLVASFWDEQCLAGWRQRAGLRRRRQHAEGRVARTRRAMAHAVTVAGGEMHSFHASLRYVSQQTFFLARPRRAAVGIPCPS